MEITQLYNSINQYQNNIKDIQGQIQVLENEIEELSALRNRLQRYAENFSVTQIIRNKNLSASISYLRAENRYSNKIVTGIEADLTEKLTGKECLDTNVKIQHAIDIVRREIMRRETQISECERKINYYKSQIEILNSDIREVEKRETNAEYNNR